MIQKVSFSSNCLYDNNKKCKKTKCNSYSHNILKQAGQSTPVLLSLTAVKTLFEYTGKELPIQKVFANNMLKFFAPLLVLSSLVFSFLECNNKK